jgi:hypothetical protein
MRQKFTHSLTHSLTHFPVPLYLADSPEFAAIWDQCAGG